MRPENHPSAAISPKQPLRSIPKITGTYCRAGVKHHRPKHSHRNRRPRPEDRNDARPEPRVKWAFPDRLPTSPVFTRVSGLLAKVRIWRHRKAFAVLSQTEEQLATGDKSRGQPGRTMQNQSPLRTLPLREITNTAFPTPRSFPSFSLSIFPHAAYACFLRALHAAAYIPLFAGMQGFSTIDAARRPAALRPISRYNRRDLVEPCALLDTALFFDRRIGESIETTKLPHCFRHFDFSRIDARAGRKEEKYSH